jgi:hypothetical protein
VVKYSWNFEYFLRPLPDNSPSEIFKTSLYFVWLAN